MYIKRYTVATLLLVVLVGWYVYAFITQESMSINLFGIVLPSLSIAMWIILPLVVLYIGSVMHMAFYSFLGSLKLRKYEKDYDNMIDSIVDAYLGKKDRKHSFKTERYKLLGSLIDNSTILANHNIKADIDNEKVSSVLKCIEIIKNGEVADLKMYNLPSYNKLAIANARNLYKSGGIKAEGILNHLEKYDESITKEVYTDFVATASQKDIQKYNKSISKEALFVILSRINAPENTIEMSNDELIALFSALELTTKDYINASHTLAKNMIPDQRIKLFETMSNDNEDIVEAYLYTLFDLEMLAPANEILENTAESEYIYFKAYSLLRESGKHFDIHLFL